MRLSVERIRLPNTMTKRSILVVDDEEVFRKRLGHLLRLEGYKVLLAKDGSEALETVERHDLNLVLLDMKLPGIDGMDVLRKSKEMKPALPIIMITAFGKIRSAVEAIKLGAYDFIEKPTDLERILITVKNALAKEQVDREKARLIENIRQRYQMVGSSRAMKAVYELIEQIAPTPLTVLILGEHGTGKELVAMAIHNLSDRVSQNFVRVNCAAIPSELIESELFGIEKAVATGVDRRIGKFEKAEGGTIFLDEIADLSAAAQAKILRALEDGEIQRIGVDEMIKVDVRIIAATNKDLATETDKGHFREDLYYRLNGITINIPPLRERKEDIKELANFFLQQYCEENNIRIKRLASSAVSALMQYPWRGNVRELKHFVEKLIVLAPSDKITDCDVKSLHESKPAVEFDSDSTLMDAKRKFEREFILIKLCANDWNIAKTARLLGIERANLYQKMKKYGLDRNSDCGVRN
ncbi:MAG: sigma-54-dependent transcriptional regulator [bacterium]